MMELSHLDRDGRASMVDIGEKPHTPRTATARAALRMQAETLEKIKANSLQKGDVLAAARLAGILAAKKTHELIPLCHALPIEKVAVDFSFLSPDRLEITAFAKCVYKTGIEMEALTAVSVAALTVYDMCKAVDRGMVIEGIRLLSKTGGRSGDFNRDEERA